MIQIQSLHIAFLSPKTTHNLLVCVSRNLYFMQAVLYAQAMQNSYCFTYTFTLNKAAYYYNISLLI